MRFSAEELAALEAYERPLLTTDRMAAIRAAFRADREGILRQVGECGSCWRGNVHFTMRIEVQHNAIYVRVSGDDLVLVTGYLA